MACHPTSLRDKWGWASTPVRVVVYDFTFLETRDRRNNPQIDIEGPARSQT
jgi:hypothetical protein